MFPARKSRPRISRAVAIQVADWHLEGGQRGTNCIWKKGRGAQIGIRNGGRGAQIGIWKRGHGAQTVFGGGDPGRRLAFGGRAAKAKAAERLDWEKDFPHDDDPQHYSNGQRNPAHSGPRISAGSACGAWRPEDGGSHWPQGNREEAPIGPKPTGSHWLKARRTKAFIGRGCGVPHGLLGSVVSASPARPTTHGSHTPAACSFTGANARSWAGLGEARPAQSSLSAGALCYRAWARRLFNCLLWTFDMSPSFFESFLTFWNNKTFSARAWQTFSVSSQIVNIFGLVGHTVSVEITWLHPHNRKAAIDNL